VPRPEAKHDGAVHWLHRLPVAVQIHMDVLVPFTGHGLGAGDECLTYVAGALPYVRMDIGNHYSTPYLS
jgi:hypothetical protein